MANTDKPPVFSKQGEFKAFIDSIQKAYIVEMGWSAEWFLQRWPHILKPEYEHLNLTQDVREVVQDWESRHPSLLFPWHKWHGIRSSRNLHSSQVLCLIALGGFIEKHTQSLEHALMQAGLLEKDETIHEFAFEYEPPNFFGEPRRTSMDFMVRVGRAGGPTSPIYFEVKFLEAHFGSCSRRSGRLCSGFTTLPAGEAAQQCLLTREGIRYWELLPEIMYLRPRELGCPIQGSFYQLARNVLHLRREEGRAFVVLSDARAGYIDGEFKRFSRSLLPEYRHLVRSIKLQELVPYLREARSSVADLLAKKYGIL